jgi:hypothetical protein
MDYDFTFRRADTTLSDTEKEDRDIRHLMPSGVKQPRKRKHERGEAAPRDNQRVKRIETSDSDLKTGVEADGDLSLRSRKATLRISADNPIRELKGILREVSDDAEFHQKIVDSFTNLKGHELYTLGTVDSSKPEYREALRSCTELIDNAEAEHAAILKNAPRPGKLPSETLIENIKKFAESGFNNVVTTNTEDSFINYLKRAAVWQWIKSSCEDTMIGAIYNIPMDSAGVLNKAKLTELILSEKSIGEVDATKLDKNKDLLAIFAFKLKKTLEDKLTKDDVDLGDFSGDMNTFKDNILQGLSVVAACQEMAKYIDETGQSDDSESFLELEDTDHTSPKDLEKKIQILDDGLSVLAKGIDFKFIKSFTTYSDVIKKFKESVKKRTGIEPNSDIYPIIFRNASTHLISNRKVVDKMKKTAQYHGVVDQGHPSGPTNTPWKSIDKRYIGKEHFASIIKSAKDYLDSPWFKSGWGEISAEAANRAALDLAIHTADGAAYQSKIDAPTYNMLLNKLSSGGYDDMVDTMLPGKMKKASGEYSLLSPEGRESLKNLSPEDRKTLDEIKQVLEESGRSDLFNEFEDIIVGLNMQQPPVDQIAKLSKPPLLSSDFAEIRAVLEKTAKILEPHHSKFATTIRDLVKWPGASQDRSGTAIARLSDESNGTQSSKVATYGEGVSNMAEHKASVEVDLNTLVRVAFENPGARATLLPIIAAKKKSKSSKSEKKPASAKSEEASSKKKPASAKKKPASAKKKPASAKKKHTASVQLDSSDYSW